MTQHANPHAYTVLVVDDDPNNVEILREILEDEGHRVLTGSDGVEGWETLQRHKADINVILLDRMMPNMNGIEFMSKLTAASNITHIPVIMQTALCDKVQVAEGVSAGVYYYLSKPYHAATVRSIVHSALYDYVSHQRLRQELGTQRDTLHLGNESHFEIQTLDDARHLAAFLAHYYPDSERVLLGISELFINAIEHGNLGINYTQKTQFQQENCWEQEIERRLRLAPYRDRKATIHFTRDRRNIWLTITDEGDGFDWKNYMEIDPQRATHSHGRGIAMSNMISFDSLEYQGNGNQVICRIALSHIND